jgi:hypothetical protein
MADYEWVVETVERDGEDEDILDVNHYDTYAEAKEYAARAGTDFDGVPVFQRIGLVRDEGQHPLNRSWAYVVDGALPSHFSDAYGHLTTKVPTKYFLQMLTTEV